MGNEIAIRILTEPGDQVVVEERSHVVEYELSGMAVLSGVVPRIVRGRGRRPDARRRSARALKPPTPNRAAASACSSSRTPTTSPGRGHAGGEHARPHRRGTGGRASRPRGRRAPLERRRGHRRVAVGAGGRSRQRDGDAFEGARAARSAPCSPPPRERIEAARRVRNSWAAGCVKRASSPPPASSRSRR